MLSDEWLPRYRLLENFTAKWNGNGNGNGNAYDRGDYNSSFALRAVELKNALKRLGKIVHKLGHSEKMKVALDEQLSWVSLLSEVISNAILCTANRFKRKGYKSLCSLLNIKVSFYFFRVSDLAH